MPSRTRLFVAALLIGWCVTGGGKGVPEIETIMEIEFRFADVLIVL